MEALSAEPQGFCQCRQPVGSVASADRGRRDPHGSVRRSNPGSLLGRGCPSRRATAERVLGGVAALRADHPRLGGKVGRDTEQAEATGEDGVSWVIFVISFSFVIAFVVSLVVAGIVWFCRKLNGKRIDVP